MTIKISRSTVVLLLLSLATPFACAQQPPAELLTNPGFDAPFIPVHPSTGKSQITGSVAHGWSDNSAWADVTITYSQASEGVHGGSTAQAVTVDGVRAGQVQLRQQFPVTAGRLYSFSIWLKGQSGSQATIAIRQPIAPWRAYGEQPVILDGSWQRVSVQGAATDTGRADAMIYPAKGSTLLIADASVKDVTDLASSAPSKPGTYAGIDFYADDKLRVPRYELSRNLVQNPGFEQGLAYWRIGPLGRLTDSHIPDYYLVDDAVSFRGGHSLKIQGEAHQIPTHLATFAIPCVAGETYTLSFYAKADRPGVKLSTRVTAAAWGTFPLSKSFPLTTEWTRYSAAFTASDNCVSPDFGIDGPPADCTAWLDCVQLEHGPLTEYTVKPYSLRLVTHARGNILQPGEPSAATIEVCGSPSAKGTIGVRVTDFNGKELSKQDYPFALNATGRAKIPQAWADKLGTGLYVVAMNITTTDGFSDREFSRFVRMPFLTAPYPNRQFFAIGALDARSGMWERRFQRFQEMGIGSCIHFNPPPPAYKAIYEADGILSLSSIFDNGDTLCGWKLLTDYRQHASPEDLAKIEQAAFDKANANLDITYWKLINEPDVHTPDAMKLANDVDEMKVYIQMLAAARRGILRANPKAIVLSPDPGNMSPQGGIKWIETFLKAGGLSVADLIAIHPYRARPEDPDLDRDIPAFLAMLDANGYHGDVWFTEGGGNSNMQIPALHLDVYKTLGEDTYRAGSLTYDLGWAEKLSTAYCERQWLIGLKYHSRIKQYIDWYLSGNCGIDQDLTPGLIAFAPNTLGRLLGDARYVRDIAVSDDVRAYAFIDAMNRPVVALWTYDLAGDHGEPTGPTLNLAKLPKGSESFDMVGSAVSLMDGKLTVGPLPMFVRGPVGSSGILCSLIESAPVVAGKNSMRIWPEVSSLTNGALKMANRSRTPITGVVTVVQPGRAPLKQAIHLAGNSVLSMPVAVTTGKQGLTAALTYTVDNGGDTAAININVPVYPVHRLSQPIQIDGDLSKWPLSQGIPITNLSMDYSPPAGMQPVPYRGAKDLSAMLWTGWDAQTFYLALHVVDDVYHPADAGKPAYTGDSVQIYFDCFADARSRKELGFNGGDESYTLSSDLQASVIDRTLAPDWQLAFAKTGPLTDAKLIVKRTADGYNVEAAIPAGDVVPLSLKEGNVFGFAALVNDNDGDYRKRGLTLTPQGTEPFGRPDLYPLFVFTR
ncbi:MAG: carbohydrate binding domain-containing protein [Capsulimonadaceae bacterium]|nr:carbohydrate binding domain-containing protein [Capsulimonadaceae bacterium]